ncbi:hypothetical protein Cri9333_1456 [Crinalium epipsammum PCC 9333]|uniref:DUF5666 domain-containing protein n=1 Tax=Crinalium epipsammum PCC 9333 TaxID=1173022 RepID=K9VYW2_9CYAN|nr:hypothetical protein [Crinalium epipsammum]AFZ12350.1 hypothetical protein Cri9333_1456 [Crinalium epipsammum PCC 9333]
MNFQTIKIVSGTSLSLLLFAISGYPVMAQTSNQMSQTGTTTVNMTAGQPVQGTVVSIVGNTVRMRLASGELTDISVPTADLQRLNLRLGTQIVATMGNDGNTTVALANGMNSSAMAATTGMDMMSQQGIRGVIRSIVGNVVTLELADGTTRSVTVSNEQRTQLNLQPGTVVTARSMTSGSNGDVFVEVANDNMASTGMINGTVRSIVGDVVTLTMPDGSARDVVLSRADIDRLNLVPGMNVAVMMNGGNTTVSLVNGTQQSTTMTSTNSIRTTSQPEMMSQNGDSTIVEERTSISETTTVSPTTTQPSNTTVNTTRRVQSRPVRALW